MGLVEIKDNVPKIKNDFKLNSSLFLRYMSDEIIRQSTSITPKKTGALRRDIIKQVLGQKAEIRWGKNYAAKQELTQFRHYTTSGTGPRFAYKGVIGGINMTSTILKKAKLV